MKILHTADWHLGKKLDHFPRIDEQRQAMTEICTIADAQQVDCIIVAGDVFDAPSPPNEARSLFYKTVKRLSADGKRPVIVIAGNHDSPEQIENPDPLAKELGIFLLGFPDSDIGCQQLDSGIEISQSNKGFLELIYPQYDYPLRIIATPYANESRLKKQLDADKTAEDLRATLTKHWQNLADTYCDDKGINLLTAHLFFMKKGGELKGDEEPEGEKPIVIGGASAVFTENIPEQIQYTALGHLHRYQNLGTDETPIVYSSSPLAYSFAEANQTKYVAIIKAEPKQTVKLEKVALQSGKPLLRKTATTIEEAILWLNANQHALVELKMETDTFLKGSEIQELKKVHKGIVSIIPPDFTNESNSEEGKTIDITQSIDELFTQYFERKYGQQPNKSILNLFNEVKGQNK